MRILTLGDSWTYGYNSSDRLTKSWPAQLSSRFDVEVVNLGQSGISNHRACRIGIEELCRDPKYDWVIFPIGPANRTEILKFGKWHRVWPKEGDDDISKLFAQYWHAWNDVQNTILLAFYFIHSLNALQIPLFITGLSLNPFQYAKEIQWIVDYKNDHDFQQLGMPLEEMNIGIQDLDRKLKSLKAIHEKNLVLQPQYLEDVVQDYFFKPEIQEKYGYSYKEFRGHPDDAGYTALADYFASKIGLSR